MKEEDNIHFTKQTKSGLFLCRILHRYCPVEESGEVVENCEGCKYIVRIGDKWVTDIKYFESINTCPYCMGTGKMDFSKDNPLCVSTCPYCEGEGNMIGYYKSKVKFEKSMTNQANRQLKMLRDNVKEISKCNTCHGNQHKTTGGTPCEECGLIGMKPWGG